MEFTARLNHKMSIACTLYRRWQQTSPIFPSETQRTSTLVAPYQPVVFIDNISLYFNFLSSVQV